MEKITLPNGLKILLEPLSYARTACFEILAKSGSAYENRQNNGISHFIEHMVFKGTQNRTSRQIAEEMDAIGGQMNAFTAKDYTCFYARTLTEHVTKGFDILADMVTSPLFDERDIETEKGVVLEEISMVEDNPEDKVAENQYASVWRYSKMGMPILGTPESLSGIDKYTLNQYSRVKYAPNRVLVAICGKFDREAFLDRVYRYFEDRQKGDEIITNSEISYIQGACVENTKQEQTHINLCMPGIDSFDKRRYDLGVLNMIAGGSTSSRLFQRIREEQGLAYSIYSSTLSYNSGGLLEVQTAVNPEMAEKAVKEIISVLANLSAGVTPREFVRAREQMKSNIMMSMESISSRVGTMGRSGLLKGYVYSEEEILEEIESVTLESVNRVASELIDLSKLSVSVVGPVKDEEFYHKIAKK